MKLEGFFKKRRHVELAYFFGSYARGETGRLSDIDVGVYLSDALSKKEKRNEQLELIAELTTVLKSDRLDLVIMNATSPAINFEIIKANAPVFVRDRGLKVDVEQRIMCDYLDRKFHEERLNMALLKRVAREGLAHAA